jgi:4'-phosphopantetheinyl transferase
VRQRHRLSHQDVTAVDIRHVAEGPERGRPFYCIDDTPGPFSLSISHAEGWATAALARGTDERVGVDIETIAPRDETFEAIAFGRDELDRLARLGGVTRWRATTRGWVLKEALLKAIGIGLTVPLPTITVDGLERDEGPWTFRPWTGVARTSRLGCVDASTVEVAVFEVDGLMGAWVVAPPEARPCPR